MSAHETRGGHFRKILRNPSGDFAVIVRLFAVAQIFVMRRGDVREIVAAEIGHSKFSKDVIQHRCRVLDGIVADHEARGLEAGEGECLDKFLQRYAVLQSDRNRDGKIVHQRPEGGALGRPDARGDRRPRGPPRR